MDKWQNLLVRVDTQPTAQVTLVPSQYGVDVKFLQGTNDPNLLDLLDELGKDRWQLVAVDGTRYWLKRPLVDTSSEAHVR
jgi:hypothetical protein